MTYTKQLPAVWQLLRLAQHTHFPATRIEVGRAARAIGSPNTVIDFIKLFPPDEPFYSRAEFMTRCEELEMLVGQERSAPEERSRSPQD